MQVTEMTTEVRQQIDAELKKAGITEVRSEMVVASAQQTEMRVSSVQKAETAVHGNTIWVTLFGLQFVWLKGLKMSISRQK